MWEDIRQLIREADALLMAPPCNAFSRARNHHVDGGGPRPIRMQDYPYGFPWLSQSDRQGAEAANVLVLRSFELAKLAITHEVMFALCERNLHVSVPRQLFPDLRMLTCFLGSSGFRLKSP